MSEYNLKLNGDTVDQLVVSILKDHKEICEDYIKKLKKTKKLENHQKIDLHDYTEINDALKVILKYFGE